MTMAPHPIGLAKHRDLPTSYTCPISASRENPKPRVRVKAGSKASTKDVA